MLVVPLYNYVYEMFTLFDKLVMEDIEMLQIIEIVITSFFELKAFDCYTFYICIA
jgi:hypothetical protein